MTEEADQKQTRNRNVKLGPIRVGTFGDNGVFTPASHQPPDAIGCDINAVVKWAKATFQNANLDMVRAYNVRIKVETVEKVAGGLV